MVGADDMAKLERELNEAQAERDQLRKVADWLALIEALQPPPSRH